MAADSDGQGEAGGGGRCGVVITCEGDLQDPRFPVRLRHLLRELRMLLSEPHPQTLKVNKVEPWNSVRLTLSVPRAAAIRLRALAAAGAPQLRALGILSVQLDGDAAVSLRLQQGTEIRINTQPDDAAVSIPQPSAELLAGLGGIGRLLSEESGTSTSAVATPEVQSAMTPTAATRDAHFKSPNTVCPMDGKIPQNIPSASTDRCEFPFGSMTQARVIHRKENTMGLPPGAPRAPTPDANVTFARPSTSTFVGPPPPYPAKPLPQAPNVAMSSPLLVNLLQNDAVSPVPRTKPVTAVPTPHPAKLDHLEDSQVELAVGRATFEYRAPRPPPPRPTAVPSPTALPPSRAPVRQTVPAFTRRPFTPRPAPVTYRTVTAPAGVAPNATVVTRPLQRYPGTPQAYVATEFSAPAPPPPYRLQLTATVRQRPNPPPPPPPPRVTPEDLQALLPPPTTSMDQKTQSSFQEFQRYQQQYNARQRAASRASTTQPDWGEAYRDSLSGLTLPELPDNCDLDQLLPTLGADLNLDETALSAISELDASTKLDLLYDAPQQDNNCSNIGMQTTSDTNSTPDSLLQEITGTSYGAGPSMMNGPYGADLHLSNTTSVRVSHSQANNIVNAHSSSVSSKTNTIESHTRGTPISSTECSETKSLPIHQSHSLVKELSTSNIQTGQFLPPPPPPLITQNHTQTSLSLLYPVSESSSAITQAATSSSSNLLASVSVSTPVATSRALPFKLPSNSMQGAAILPGGSNYSNKSNSQQTPAKSNMIMPPPVRPLNRPSSSVSTATVASQATAQEIEEQSKQYLIKSLMRDDDIPPKEPKEKAEEVIVAQCKVSIDNKETEKPENIFAQSLIKTDSPPIPEENKKSDDDSKIKNKIVKKEKDDKVVAQKGGKPRTPGVKEKPTILKDKIIKDGKPAKTIVARPPVKQNPPPTADSPKSPSGEKESIKLRLKLDKNEPVVSPVYKADVSFVNQQPKREGEKQAEAELRVPPLHISLRGRNSAVIKNLNKKEKKRLNPISGDYSKKIKIRKPVDLHRRVEGEAINMVLKGGNSENAKSEFIHQNMKLNNHYEGETVRTETSGGNIVSYRMKTISKNSHIVTKSLESKLNNKTMLNTLKLKKKSKSLMDCKSNMGVIESDQSDREKEWRNSLLEKEGKYAQNEGYRESSNHETKSHMKKLPNPVMKSDKDMLNRLELCDLSLKSSDIKSVIDTELQNMRVEVSSVMQNSSASDVDNRLLKCHKTERTISADSEMDIVSKYVGHRRGSDSEMVANQAKLKRTLTESAITSPNGLISEKKRKTSHSSCPDPPGSTNVGTVGSLSPCPVPSQRPAGATSPRRKERPKDKSYCKLMAERARPDADKFGNRSPSSQAQGEDSGIESMDALSEKSPNQASQSPPGPQRKERLDMPRSTSPNSVQRIIGVLEPAPASDELLERLSLTSQPHYDPVPSDIDDIEVELAKMHADINGDDAPRRLLDNRTSLPCTDTKDVEVKREPTPILRDEDRDSPIRRSHELNRLSKNVTHELDTAPSNGCNEIPKKLTMESEKMLECKIAQKEEICNDKNEIKLETPPKKEKNHSDDFDPLPTRVSPPLYTYSNPEKCLDHSENGDQKSSPNGNDQDQSDSKLERLPLKADFPDKSLLEQLLIEIPTPDYVGKRTESPSPSALERVARSSVRTRSSSKMNSPADGPRTPRLSPALNKFDRSDSPALPRNCLRSGSVDKTSPLANIPVKPNMGGKRKRRESESSCASTISCEEGLSPAGRPKKKPRRTVHISVDSQKSAVPPSTTEPKSKTKDSDSDSDEPLICKVRCGKAPKGLRAVVSAPRPTLGAPVKPCTEGVGTRRSVRHGVPTSAPSPAVPVAPPAVPSATTPVRRKTRSAVGENTTPSAGLVRRRRSSRDGK